MIRGLIREATFRSQSFVSQNAAVQVRDEKQLEDAIADILSDPAKASELGRNALRVVRENSGAIERTVEMIVEGMTNRELYVAAKRQENG